MDLCQLVDNVSFNMQNIYVMLLDLPSIYGFIILQDIIIQKVHKSNFKKG
jgi:hypothetical protein